MGIRDKIKRLERGSKGDMWELVCPAEGCGWETTVYGDVHTDLIVLDYEANLSSDSEADEHSTFSPHPSVVKLFEHEHPAEDFIEKRSGRNLYDPAISGMGLASTHPEDLD